MHIRTLAISVLGLAALAPPAHATLTFFNGSTSAGTAANAISLFNTAAAALFFPEPMTTFASGGLSGTPAVYTDPTTDTEFFGFTYSGGVNGSQDGLTMSGTQLRQSNSGGIIEITGFPSMTFAFAAEVQTIVGFSGTGNYCLEENVTSFNQGGNCNLTFSPTSLSDVEFIGLFDSSTPITNVWIGPVGGLYSSETTAIVNSEIGDTGSDTGSETPEAATMALIGGGLILLGGARRWRTPIAAPSQ